MPSRSLDPGTTPSHSCMSTTLHKRNGTCHWLPPRSFLSPGEVQEFGFREIPDSEPRTTAFAQQPNPASGADQAPKEGAEGRIMAQGAQAGQGRPGPDRSAPAGNL